MSQLIKHTCGAVMLEQSDCYGFRGVVFGWVNRWVMAEMFYQENGTGITIFIGRGDCNVVYTNGAAVGIRLEAECLRLESIDAGGSSLLADGTLADVIAASFDGDAGLWESLLGKRPSVISTIM
jgi:hypothetical protein